MGHRFSTAEHPAVGYRVRHSSAANKARGLQARVRKRYRSAKREVGWRVEQSTYTNIYHCCTQKTASQFFRRVYADPAFFRYTGLHVHPHREVGLADSVFDEALPPHTIAYLYTGYPAFRDMPKPDAWKALFLLRDPRDAVVSWYFGVQGGMDLINVVPEMRHQVEARDRQAGLRYVIDRLDELGYFQAQRSWMDPEVDEAGIRIFRYRDLARDNLQFLCDLFTHLDINMPREEVEAILRRQPFGGKADRRQGEESLGQHDRKGTPGDWVNHFDAETADYFTEVTGDLLEILGFPAAPT